MIIKVQLEDGEYVDDWSAFRHVFDEAAKKVGQSLSMIIHTDEELSDE
jgi:hypothetical protein